MRQTTIVGDFNRVRAYNEGLVVYLYDDSLLEVSKQRGDIDQLQWQDKCGREAASAFPPGDLLAYELRQDDDIRVDVAVHPPLSPEEIAQIGALEPLSGFLRLSTGRLCVECANNFRFDPEYDEAEEEHGAIVQVPHGGYRVWVYHIDMDAMPADEQYEYRGPFQVITLETVATEEIPPRGSAYLPFPRKKKALPERRLDTSWSGKYTLEGDVFTGIFVHNYDVSGPCINFDRHAEIALALRIGCRLAIEFESARIVALFLGNADGLDATRNLTKCGFVKDREGVEKLMLFEFTDRDMMHFDFRKKPLYGTPVRIRRLD